MASDELRENVILAQLPDREFDQVAGRARIIDAEVRQQVYRPRESIGEVFFPLSCVYSLVAMADERVLVEVATIGREGMVGLPLFLGAATSPQASFCQVPGRSARLAADDLRQVLSDDGTLHQVLNRFTQATMVQVAQNVACNSTHSTEQRAARWLLTTGDRVGREEFSLTQEFLAQMLGVRRPTVSEVARRLGALGLIRYRHGVITLLDRAGLHEVACPCYDIIRAEFDAPTHAN